MKNKKKIAIFVLIIIPIVVVTILCYKFGCHNDNYHFTESPNKISAEFTSFTGEIIKELKFNKTSIYKFIYSPYIKQGSLSVQLYDEKKQNLLIFENDKNCVKEILISDTEIYKLIITGNKIINGAYQIEWLIK